MPNLWDFWLLSNTDGEQRAIIAGGNAAGKTSAMVIFAKNNPLWKIVVPDVKSLDMFVKMGLQPSQIVVAQELIQAKPKVQLLSVTKLKEMF